MKCENCFYEWKPRTEFPYQCTLCKCRSFWIEKPSKCGVCEKTFNELNEHHIDGNRKNTFFGNRIPICKFCHGQLHTGVRFFGQNKGQRCAERIYLEGDKIALRIEALRRIWLNSIKKREAIGGKK